MNPRAVVEVVVQQSFDIFKKARNAANKTSYSRGIMHRRFPGVGVGVLYNFISQ